jgi:hypothetical protein
MKTPLLLIARRIRCSTCGVRTVHLKSEPCSIEHDVHGKPRE